ncbi:hypothetical protein SEVIR_5G087350v4 [Setaria viridis]|uniref:Uncharacterized protein n=1 Tax=Setaria italica TaxID=4555 RepID=A0A368R2S3_SETIT|nr:hypothetical protein SETIT_5G088800v2 [Setaria italica]
MVGEGRERLGKQLTSNLARTGRSSPGPSLSSPGRAPSTMDPAGRVGEVAWTRSGLALYHGKRAGVGDGGVSCVARRHPPGATIAGRAARPLGFLLWHHLMTA